MEKIGKTTNEKNSLFRLAKKLEHSVLSPATTEREVVEGCAVARRYEVGVMMVQPSWLSLAVNELAGSDVTPASVLSFPHGASLPEAKAFEADRLATRGAREIDMVLNVGALKSGDSKGVLRDVQGVVEAARGRAAIKVILEICLLTDDEIARACEICERAGAAFVKTSTGFGGGGATRKAVRLMRTSVGPSVGVKASGGIRTLSDVLGMLESGADRIGTSATVKIMEELSAIPENERSRPML